MKTKTVKTFTGKVVSTKMTKTVVVDVSHIVRHPVYKKALTVTNKFVVHNELPDIAVGDFVKIAETRPISRLKHFKVIEKIKI